jgi:hypothetical protein
MSINFSVSILLGGTRWRSGLRHCPTNRKVAGSIHWNFFHLHNTSSLAITLGSTQLLNEMSTKDISWGIKAASA